MDFLNPAIDEQYHSFIKEALAPRKKTYTLRQLLCHAARRVREPVSQAQEEAGNYRMGHVCMHGLRFTIVNPKGSIRHGVSGNGHSWSTTMKHHYGYIRGTSGGDDSQIDCYIGDSPESEIVFVVDQYDREGKRWDEHKVMIGFNNESEAREAYLAHYPAGWLGYGGITPLTIDQFKEWLDSGDQRRPISEQTFAMKQGSYERTKLILSRPFYVRIV